MEARCAYKTGCCRLFPSATAPKQVCGLLCQQPVMTFRLQGSHIRVKPVPFQQCLGAPAPATVRIRWAMISTVLSLTSRDRASCTAVSFSTSQKRGISAAAVNLPPPEGPAGAATAPSSTEKLASLSSRIAEGYMLEGHPVPPGCFGRGRGGKRGADPCSRPASSSAGRERPSASRRSAARRRPAESPLPP